MKSMPTLEDHPMGPRSNRHLGLCVADPALFAVTVAEADNEYSLVTPESENPWAR
jgi:hypothetical protein